MILFLLGLIIGAALGLIGLRLLAFWQARSLHKPSFFGRPHQRH